jgi:hypothetical protein
MMLSNGQPLELTIRLMTEVGAHFSFEEFWSLDLMRLFVWLLSGRDRYPSSRVRWFQRIHIRALTSKEPTPVSVLFDQGSELLPTIYA